MSVVTPLSRQTTSYTSSGPSNSDIERISSFTSRSLIRSVIPSHTPSHISSPLPPHSPSLTSCPVLHPPKSIQLLTHSLTHPLTGPLTYSVVPLSRHIMSHGMYSRLALPAPRCTPNLNTSQSNARGPIDFGRTIQVGSSQRSQYALPCVHGTSVGGWVDAV